MFLIKLIASVSKFRICRAVLVRIKTLTEPPKSLGKRVDLRGFVISLGAALSALAKSGSARSSLPGSPAHACTPDSPPVGLAALLAAEAACSAALCSAAAFRTRPQNGRQGGLGPQVDQGGGRPASPRPVPTPGPTPAGPVHQQPRPAPPWPGRCHARPRDNSPGFRQNLVTT